MVGSPGLVSSSAAPATLRTAAGTGAQRCGRLVSVTLPTASNAQPVANPTRAQATTVASLLPAAGPRARAEPTTAPRAREAATTLPSGPSLEGAAGSVRGPVEPADLADRVDRVDRVERVERWGCVVVMTLSSVGVAQAVWRLDHGGLVRCCSPRSHGQDQLSSRSVRWRCF